MYATLGMLKGGAGGGGGGGTFPSIVSYTFSHEISAPYNADMPATVAAGDLLIMLVHAVSIVTPGTISTPSGWTQLFAVASTLENNGFYKWAVGTEGGTFVTVSIGDSAQYITTVIRLNGVDTGQNPQAVWGSSTATANPDPSALDPTWADANNLFIAWVGTDSDRSVSSYPTGYTLHQQVYDSGTGSSIACAKQVSISASENPSIFTLSSSANCHVATIAVKGT